MYSPKIDPSLISPLYHQAKAKGIPMTKLVNEILSEHLQPESVSDKPSENSIPMGFYSTDHNKEAV